MRLSAIALVLLGALGLSFLFAPARRSIASMTLELAELRKTNEALRRENRRMAREARLLRDDPRALERVARHLYGLVRDDEWVLSPAPAPVPRAALPLSAEPQASLARSP